MGLFDKLFGRAWEKCRKRGDQFYEQEQWGRARGEYEEALRTFSSKSPEDDSARLAIKERLGLVNHHLTEMHLGLAQRVERSDPRKAIEHIQVALDFAPQARHEELLQRITHLETEMSRPVAAVPRVPHEPVMVDNAQEVFNVLLADMDDTRADVYEALGEPFREGYMCLMEGKLEQAESYLLPLYEADKGNLYLQYEIGRLRLAQGQFDQAVELLDAALAQDPNLLFLHHTLVQALWGKGDMERAERTIEDAFALNDTLLDNFVLAGETCLRSGEYDNGVELMQAGLELHERSAHLYRLLAQLQVARKNIPAALEALESVLRLRWNYDYETKQMDFDREAAFLAAQLNLEHKLNLARAEELFRTLVSTPDQLNRPIFLLGLGDSLLAQDKNGEAKPFLIDALAQVPEGSPAHARIRASLAKLGI